MENKKILFISVIFFWFAQYIYIPFQTPYLTAMNISSSFIGIIIGAYGISQMLLRLPVGLLADKNNKHKTFIIIGGCSSGIASIFRCLFDNGYAYLIGNIFSGLSSAMWISFMILYMSYYDKDKQHIATSKIILANNLGILLGFLTSTLLYDYVSMRFICALSIVAGTISAILSCFLTEKTCIKSNYSIKQLLEVCLNKKLILFSLFALIQQGVQMSTTMSFTTQIIKELGASSFIVGISSIIYMISAVSWAQFASTSLCNRIKSKVWIPLIFIINAIYCYIVPNSESIIIICILQILPGMSTGILFSYLTSEAMSNVPTTKKSTAMGCYQAIYALGMTLFPIICGQIMNIFSINKAYYFLAIICIITSICAYLYYLKRQ